MLYKCTSPKRCCFIQLLSRGFFFCHLPLSPVEGCSPGCALLCTGLQVDKLLEVIYVFIFFYFVSKNCFTLNEMCKDLEGSVQTKVGWKRIRRVKS